MPLERFSLVPEPSSVGNEASDDFFNDAFITLQKRVYQRVFEKN
jgi:hypothetical protein